MKNNKDKVMGALIRIKNGVINMTSDMMSYPKRTMFDAMAESRNQTADSTKMAREKKQARIASNSY